MIEFRYVIRKSSATAEKIREYANEHDIPLMLAKRELEDVTDPILQYRVLPVPALWQDVQTVVEYRNE
jgi:hypothetical protein